MNQKSKRGGARPNSGRPRKNDHNWGQITCILRKDTIQKLREGAGGKQRHFGQFLQHHLDKFPLPTREVYIEERYLEAWRKNRESLTPEQLRIVKGIRSARAYKRQLDREYNEALMKERTLDPALPFDFPFDRRLTAQEREFYGVRLAERTMREKQKKETAEKAAKKAAKAKVAA